MKTAVDTFISTMDGSGGCLEGTAPYDGYLGHYKQYWAEAARADCIYFCIDLTFHRCLPSGVRLEEGVSRGLAVSDCLKGTARKETPVSKLA